MMYTIDLANKSLGRSASEVASILRGKDSVSFEPRVAPSVTVRIESVDKLRIPLRKRESKVYARSSRYPGGLKKETMTRLLTRRGYEEVFRRAVYGMLPSNKLRARMMKNLIFV